MSQRERVPAEFLGLSRLFRNRVLAADKAYIACVYRITAAIEDRLTRKHLGKKHILDICHWFRAMQMPYRLLLDAQSGSRRRLTITDYRLSATSANNIEWQSPELEPGVAITKVVLTIANGFKLDTSPHSVVSLHALGRRYERSGLRDDDSLMADITALLTTNEFDRVSCPSGTWLSNVVIAKDDSGRSFRTRDVRTFIVPADALEFVSA